MAGTVRMTYPLKEYLSSSKTLWGALAAASQAVGHAGVLFAVCVGQPVVFSSGYMSPAPGQCNRHVCHRNYTAVAVTRRETRGDGCSEVGSDDDAMVRWYVGAHGGGTWARSS